MNLAAGSCSYTSQRVYLLFCAKTSSKPSNTARAVLAVELRADDGAPCLREAAGETARNPEYLRHRKRLNP